MCNTSIHCAKDLLQDSKRGLVSPDSIFISIVTSETKPLNLYGRGEDTRVSTYYEMNEDMGISRCGSLYFLGMTVLLDCFLSITTMA